MRGNGLRQPNACERSLLDRLLEEEFPGRDELREQLSSCLVEPIDRNGSLEFAVRTDVKTPVRWRIPVEGEAQDEDGVTIHVLLHVIEGKVDELEIYKDDVQNEVSTKVDPYRMWLLRPG